MRSGEDDDRSSPPRRAAQELRLRVIAALEEAVRAHASGRFDQIGELWNSLAAAAYQENEDAELRVALEFLHGWYDSANHGWLFYEPLGRDEWPRLSRGLARSLQSGEPIAEEVRQLFWHEPRQDVWHRFRRWLKGAL